jgi:hypothetical protein
MALVPHRARDFTVAPREWVGAISGRPAGAPVKGSRASTRQKTSGKMSVRKLMLECAQRQWLHQVLSASVPGTAGTVYPLNDLVQGTTVSTRLGDQVRFVEFEYCGFLACPVTNGYEAGRVVLFRDSQPSGVLPTVAELLCTASTGSCFNPDLVGNQNLPRFKILANHYFVWQNETPFTTTQSFVSPVITGRVRLDFTSTYIGNAGTYADLQTNGLYFLAITGGASTTLTMDSCLKFLRM